MSSRVVFRATIAVFLILALAVPRIASGENLYGLLGRWSPHALLNEAAHAGLVIVLVLCVPHLFVEILRWGYIFLSRLVDGPMFRVAHARGETVGLDAKRPRETLLSPRAIDFLSKVEVMLLQTSRRSWSTLFHISRPSTAAFWTITIGTLIALKKEEVTTLLMSRAVGDMLGGATSNLALVISASALALSTLPLLVLAFLLFSPSGSRIRLRNSSQLVAESAKYLAKLDALLYDVIAASDAFSEHLVHVRASFLIAAVEEATEGHVLWPGSGRPLFTNQRWGIRRGGSEDERRSQYDALKAELLESTTALEDHLREIEEAGLSLVCEAITHPIGSQLSDAGIHFRSRSGHSAFTRGEARSSLLWRLFSADIFFSGRGGPDLVRALGAAWQAFLREEARGVDQRSDVNSRVLPKIDRIIHLNAQSADRALVLESVVRLQLDAVREFLFKHVVGGRVDDIVQRMK